MHDQMRDVVAVAILAVFWLFIAGVGVMFWWPLLLYSGHYWFG